MADDTPTVEKRALLIEIDFCLERAFAGRGKGSGRIVELLDALIAAVRAENEPCEGAIRQGYTLRLRDGRVIEELNETKEEEIERIRESAGRTIGELRSTLADSSAREQALEQALRRKQPPYVANGFRYGTVDDLIAAHEMEDE